MSLELELSESLKNPTLTESERNAISCQLQQYEPILRPNPQRFVIFPIKYPDVWKAYKQQEASFWTTEEQSFSDDIKQWKSPPNESFSQDDRDYIKKVLGLFACADGLINENLSNNFISEVQIPEARCAYGFQMMMENIHGETYSLMIDTFITDPIEKADLFNSIETVPSVAKFAQWAQKWMNPSRPFNQRIIAFACIEGIIFSGPFCAIFWLKKRGLMPGLCFSNELISRDEGQHTDFACLMNSLLKYPATHEIIQSIIDEVVEIEKELIQDWLPVRLIGMNADSMTEYIEYVADRLLNQLKVPKFYGTKNPFLWMDLISAEIKTNFFEKRVGDYSLDISSDKKDANNAIEIPENF
jgi:ribonucleotide reductase beta subunit family protein with ferritin-like domain